MQIRIVIAAVATLASLFVTGCASTATRQPVAPQPSPAEGASAESPADLADLAALEAELTAFNKQLTDAYQRNDAEAVNRMLAPDHVHINVFGWAMGKDVFLRDIRSGTLVFSRYQTTELTWFIRGDTAIATGIIEAEATRAGKPVPSNQFRFTRIFVRDGDSWRVLLFHNTIVGTPRGAPQG